MSAKFSFVERVVLRAGRSLIRCVVLILLFAGSGSSVSAEEVNVRLRIAWGTNEPAKHRWSGQISCSGATLTGLQPLGVEADASAAVLLHENRIYVDPHDKRGFDGCDVTVAGDSEAIMRFELRSDQAGTPTVIESPLGKLVREQLREPLDSMGGFLLVYRSPGDQIRVQLDRKNLIFQPEENWPLRLQTDLGRQMISGPAVLEVVMRKLGQETILWQTSQSLDPNALDRQQLSIDVPCPQVEGGYRLSLIVRTEPSLTTRIVPGQIPKPIMTREIDFAVIDPQTRLPELTDRWTPLLSIDPANPSWWQRLPTWAQVSRLTGKPPGAIGNVRLLLRQDDPHGFVELPPSSNMTDPSWQSFAMPILEVGVPHVVEISYPRQERLHLGISIIEPDAAGRVMSTIVDSGICNHEVIEPERSEVGTHQIIFWPRTSSPQLLIVNRGHADSGVFGRITLSRLETTNPVGPAPSNDSRTVAAYTAKPIFPVNFGAAEVLDPASGMSVQSWSTFIDGAQRFAQYLKFNGYNSALVSVAADGSTLYPSEVLNPSPRYDTGVLASNGQDPIRKDVVEMLLRIGDREQVRFIPAIQLAMPLPRLEAARLAADSLGIEFVDVSGQSRKSSRRAAQYNLLDERVRQEIAAVIVEIARRYSKHSSLSGIALQLDSNGFGVLPGLAWGVDDRTLARFCSEEGLEPFSRGLLLEDYREQWQAWRTQIVTKFYSELAMEIQKERSDLKLILMTENLFADPELKQASRSHASNPNQLKQLLAERGIDLEALASIPGLQIVNTNRLLSGRRLQERVADLTSNEAAHDALFAKGQPWAVIQSFEDSRVQSFDSLSPFGVDRTHLSLAMPVLPSSEVSQRSLMSTLQADGIPAVFVGGEFLTTVFNPKSRDSLKTLQDLPREFQETASFRKQPFVLKIVRDKNASYLLCINEAPWTASATMELQLDKPTLWRRLGDVSNAKPAGIPAEGYATASDSWPVQLGPYEFRAWRFDTQQLRIKNLKIATNTIGIAYLEQKIEEISSRTGNLNIARDYPQLQNPGFELDEGTARIFGWQPRKGVNGAVEVQATTARSGAKALRLQSTDNIGVAVQSHLFALPRTGMLNISADVFASNLDESSRLMVAVETDENGEAYRRSTIYESASLPVGEWKSVVLSVHDLPVGDAEQVRIQFHLVGRGEVILDDVQLCDLQFDDQRKSELVKRIFAAKSALQEAEVIDCLRLVEGYWPRYLVENVPPTQREPVIAKQPEVKSGVGDDKKGRLRGWVPRILR